MDSDSEILLQYLAQLDVMSLIAGVFFVVLLFCSALISGTEVAFFSLSPNDLEKLKSEICLENHDHSIGTHWVNLKLSY